MVSIIGHMENHICMKGKLSLEFGKYGGVLISIRILKEEEYLRALTICGNGLCISRHIKQALEDIKLDLLDIKGS